MNQLPKNELIPDFPVSWIKPRRSPIGEDTDFGKYQIDNATGHEFGDVKVYDDRQYQMLEASIRRYGFTEPILLNPDFSVSHGQLRYEVAKLMGLATVPVMLSEQANEAYVLFADQLHRWSSWNHAITDIMLLNPRKVLPEQRKELRDIGWFVNDVPKHLTSPSFTLESVVRQIILKERAQIYTFKPTDLLFIEPTRWELIHFWEAADEYKALAQRVRDNYWDLGSIKRVGTEEELDAAIMDVLNFIAYNIKRHENGEG